MTYVKICALKCFEFAGWPNLSLNFRLRRAAFSCWGSAPNPPPMKGPNIVNGHLKNLSCIRRIWQLGQYDKSMQWMSSFPNICSYNFGTNNRRNRLWIPLESYLKDKSIDISTKTLGQNLPDLIKNRTFFYYPHPLYFLTIGKKTCFFLVI